MYFVPEISRTQSSTLRYGALFRRTGMDRCRVQARGHDRDGQSAAALQPLWLLTSTELHVSVETTICNNFASSPIPFLASTDLHVNIEI